LVAEDGGNLEIVALTPAGDVKPIMRLTGTVGTEITGPALNPTGDRLYFSSQRSPGITYEISGPFLTTGPPPEEPPPVPATLPLGQGVVVSALAAAMLVMVKNRRIQEGEPPDDEVEVDG
jgi:hypothetical protein